MNMIHMTKASFRECIFKLQYIGGHISHVEVIGTQLLNNIQSFTWFTGDQRSMTN